jgi:hypothetical protein
MEDHGTVPCDPLQAGARIDRGDEGNLDEGESRISRGVREFRSNDRPAQTGSRNRIRRSNVGGAFPHGARRAIRYGDGWIPGGDIREVLPKFRDMARQAGRNPASIEITSFALGEDPDRVKRLAEMGVARVVPMFPPGKADTVLPIVDRWTKIMRQVNG